MTVRFLRIASIIPLLALATAAMPAPMRAQPLRPRGTSAKPTPGQIADYKAFALRLEGAIRNCNPLAIAGMLDRDALLNAITEGNVVPEPERTRFFASAAPGFGLGEVVCRKTADGGNCRYVGLNMIRGVPRATFRVMSAAGTFDYYEFLLTGSGEDVRFTDVFLLSGGDLFSDFVRTSIASEPKVVIYPYLKSHNELPIGDALERMVLLERYREPDKILRYYDSLPTDLRRAKPILLHAVTAASVAGRERFRDLLDTLRSFYPDDPSLDLYLIQYFESLGDYGSFLAAVDQIDRRVHDPWLNVMRAKACMLAGRYPLARRFATAAIAYDSTLIDPRWVLVVVNLKDRNFKEAIAIIDYIATKQDVEPYLAELAKSSVGKELIRSREYQEWRKGK